MSEAASKRTREDEDGEASGDDEYKDFEIERIWKYRRSQNPTSQNGREFLVEWKGEWPGEQYQWVASDDLGDSKSMLNAFYMRDPHVDLRDANPELLQHFDAVVEPRDKQITGDCAVGSNLLAGTGDRWFNMEVMSCVPAAGFPLLVCKVGGDADSPEMLAEKGMREEKNRAENAMKEAIAAKEKGDAQMDKLANKFRTLLRYLTPPNAKVDGKKFTGNDFKKLDSQQLADFALMPFMRQFEAYQAGFMDESMGGRGSGGSASD